MKTESKTWDTTENKSDMRPTIPEEFHNICNEESIETANKSYNLYEGLCPVNRKIIRFAEKYKISYKEAYDILICGKKFVKKRRK